MKEKDWKTNTTRTLSAITEHEVIEGTVVAMNNREVVVNIGFKSDGVIPFTNSGTILTSRSAIKSKFMLKTRKISADSCSFPTKKHAS